MALKKLIATAVIIRPVNFIITLLSVAAAVVIGSGGAFPYNIMLLAGISAALTGAAGNIINDIVDIDIDKINRPGRPLPKGSIGIASAGQLAILFALAAVFTGLFLGSIPFVIVLFSNAIIFLYSFHFKKILLFGNIVVSFFTGLAFIYGAAAAGNIEAGIVPGLFAFLINLMREIVKDAEDIEGDSAQKVYTFPARFGYTKTVRLLLLFSALLFIGTLLPFFFRYYAIAYFVIVMLTVNPILVYAVKLLYSGKGKSTFSRISFLYKIAMVFGLAAIVMGVLFR